MKLSHMFIFWVGLTLGLIWRCRWFILALLVLWLYYLATV